jgi:hypothetical protein
MALVALAFASSNSRVSTTHTATPNPNHLVCEVTDGKRRTQWTARWLTGSLAGERREERLETFGAAGALHAFACQWRAQRVVQVGPGLPWNLAQIFFSTSRSPPKLGPMLLFLPKASPSSEHSEQSFGSVLPPAAERRLLVPSTLPSLPARLSSEHRGVASPSGEEPAGSRCGAAPSPPGAGLSCGRARVCNLPPLLIELHLLPDPLDLGSAQVRK